MPKPLILIADANAHIRCFLKRELLAKDFEIIFAKSHMEVLKRLETGRKPDLVVLDPDLPFIGGVSALLRIKSKAPRIPVVIYTAYAEDADNPAYSRADAIVEKIPNPVFLVRTILDLLSGYGKDRSETGLGLKKNHDQGEQIEK